MPHPMNWIFGWCLVLSGFVVGAGLGLFFHREDFWGGYSSFRRRIARLGHIAQVMLGLFNVVYGISPWPTTLSPWGAPAGVLWIVGGVLMPLVCFLCIWKPGFRNLFFAPVVSLMLAVIFTLLGGL